MVQDELCHQMPGATIVQSDADGAVFFINSEFINASAEVQTVDSNSSRSSGFSTRKLLQYAKVACGFKGTQANFPSEALRFLSSL